MTAQMNHINQRTVIEDRPTDTDVRTTAPANSKPVRPETPNGRRGPRWLGPLVAIGAIAAVGTVLVVDANSDSTPTPAASAETAVVDAGPSARELVDQSIADALAEQDAAAAGTRDFTVARGSTGDPFRVPERVAATAATPTVLDRSIVAIEHAASQANESATTEFTTAQQLVQQSIDQALADQAGQGSGNSFDRAEANRMNTLRDLSGTTGEFEWCTLGGPC